MATSLRTRVGAVVAVFMAVSASGAGLIASRQMSEMTHLAALREGRAVLDALAIPAAIAIATHDFAKLDNFVAELGRVENNEIMELIVVDHQGRVLATNKTGFVGSRTRAFDQTFVARALASEESWYAFGPDPGAPAHLEISRPIYQGQRWGTILARFSLSSLTEGLDRLVRWAVAATVIAAVAGWLIAFYFLAALVITPTHELAEMARKLGEGELEVRSTIRRSDEIGALAASLNLMADRLKAYTQGLEAAVHERTKALEEANRALGEANRELEELATTDGLTGLRNHRYFQSTLEFEIKRGARRVQQLVLCMIDIDYFKVFNDTHGHPAGDDVLRAVGKLLSENLRSTDVVARYGGEEFAVILLDTPPDEGVRTAQKICALFRTQPFSGEHTQPGGKLTVSIGVASYPEDARGPGQLVRAADLALYEAKRRGRNNVVRYSVEIPQHTGLTQDTIPESPIDGQGPEVKDA